jgi:hypothetical protein
VLQTVPARPTPAPSCMVSSSMVQAIPVHARAISRASGTPEATPEPSGLPVVTKSCISKNTNTSRVHSMPHSRVRRFFEIASLEPPRLLDEDNLRQSSNLSSMYVGTNITRMEPLAMGAQSRASSAPINETSDHEAAKQRRGHVAFASRRSTRGMALTSAARVLHAEARTVPLADIECSPYTAACWGFPHC